MNNRITSFNNIRAIFKRELSNYFSSSLAYVFIVIFLVLQGFFTFHISRWYEAGQDDLRAFFDWHPWIFLFLIPAVAMRLWSEERRLGTMELMFTLPITTAEAITGKFTAAWFFIGIALFLTFPIVFTAMYLGSPDLGVILCGYIGSFLMAGAFLSVGTMTSSLTRSQVVSFILAVVFCLFFILAGFPPVTDTLSGWTPVWFVDIVSNLSFLTHFDSIKRGVVDFRDFFYFLSVMVFMLFANAVILKSRRTA